MVRQVTQNKNKVWLVPSEFSDEDGTKMARLDAWANAMIKKHNIIIEEDNNDL